jgi:hypothetical protein
LSHSSRRVGAVTEVIARPACACFDIGGCRAAGSGAFTTLL